MATKNEHFLAVDLVTDLGEIALNYVGPDTRFCSVSKLFLKALERRAVERGCTLCNLNSTEIARRFYLSNSFAERVPPAGRIVQI